MRRFDPAYVEMKATAGSGAIGAALLLHCVHRNARIHPYFTAAMSITNAAVHEFDISRWLLDQEIARVQVMQSMKSAGAAFLDPMVTILHTAKNQIVDIEVYLSAQYGYDIRGELVGETGTVSLTPPVNSEMRLAGGQSFGFAGDWRPRFAAAYRLQLQAWVAAIASGTPVGASAWDGYAATAVAVAGVNSLETGEAVAVELESRPKLYA